MSLNPSAEKSEKAVVSNRAYNIFVEPNPLIPVVPKALLFSDVRC